MKEMAIRNEITEARGRQKFLRIETEREQHMIKGKIIIIEEIKNVLFDYLW